MALSQHEAAPAIQDFLQWRSHPDTSRQGCRGSEDATGAIESRYIPLGTLKAYLTTERIRSLLAQLYPNTHHAPDADRVQAYFLRPFAILLSAGFGHMIHYFVGHRYEDKHLPFSIEPKKFPKSLTREFFNEFCKKQWQFYPMQLDYDMSDDDLDGDCILPILRKEEIGSGGSAIVYKITVDKDYNSLIPVPAGHSDTVAQRPNPNIFALKTYRTHDASKYFENERSAFRELRYGGKPHPNIIGYYGSFVGDGTYNLVLEYADRGTLDNYMDHTEEPKTVSDITRFWERLLAVLGGLVQIHGTPGSNTDGPNILLGWHHDIDPTNILVIGRNQDSPYDCDFKIADLGLAHFKRYECSLMDATDDNRYGTNTYGAPETHRIRDLQRCHMQVPQNADIWSMGCIFSEVATWISEGKPKLLEYRRRRKQEIHEKSKTASEECFHHRSEVLGTVVRIHHEIMETSRRNDYITPSVIKQLVNGMIRIDPRSRGSAPYLYETSKEIFKEAKIKLKSTLLDSPAPNPDHTISDAVIDVRKRRFPPNSPPGRGPQVPARPSDVGDNVLLPLEAAELHNSTPRSVGQDLNRLQQGRAAQNLGEHSDQQGGEPFGVHSDYFAAQTEESRAYRPSQRIASHLAVSSVQSHQYARSSTSTAGIAGPSPSSRPQGPLTDAYDTTNALILPQRPRESRATINGLLASRVELNDEMSDFASSERADLANHNHTLFQDHQPTVPNTHTRSSVGRRSAPDQRQRPTMSVEEGLRVRRARRSSRATYPGEEQISQKDNILKKRDHVFLIDNAESMAPHRAKVERVIELLSSLTAPYDPDGLDLYFSTESTKQRPKSPEEFMRLLQVRPAKDLPDFRDRFATIIDKYKSKFGKRNTLSKIRHPNSTPSKGPRRLSLYVLTDGIWDRKCNLITEIQDLVALLLEHHKPNKYVGIQFIRFGNDALAKERLKHLDAGLGLGLDVVDTTSADGNVWKMLFGAVNDLYDNDHDGDSDDEDEIPIIRELH